MSLHNLGFGPQDTLSGVPVIPGQLIAAKPPNSGEATSVTAPDPGLLQRLLGIGGDASSLDQILKILGSVFPTSGLSIATGAGVGINGGIGGLVGSILGVGKDK